MAGGHKKLGIGLMCADWRLHQGHVNFNRKLARLMGVHGVDINAVPGPDGLILPERETEWASVVGWVNLLIGAHEPVALAVIAHQRCAGHPVSDEQHEKDAVAAARALKQATGFAGPVHAVVAVYHNDNKWRLKRIARL